MSTVALVLCWAASPAVAATSQQTYHIVIPRRAFGPLEGADVRLHPAPPADLVVSWAGVSKRKNGTQAGAWFQAPYVIRADQPTARIVATLTSQEGSFDVVAEVPLTPGSIPGAEDCLGPGQSFSETAPELLPQYTPFDEFPSLIRATQPRLPNGIRPDQLPQPIVVHALVCRTGRVIDAYAPGAAGGGPGASAPGDALEHDPRLVSAAIESVLQYEFTPAKGGGVPIATWVAVPVKFAQ